MVTYFKSEYMIEILLKFGKTIQIPLDIFQMGTSKGIVAI